MKIKESLIQKHNREFLDLLKINNFEKKKIITLIKKLRKLKKNKKKIIIAGNGGSAAIASHFSVDMTKNGNIRCINFNESDLLTCFSNDYGYENWTKAALKFYSDKGDLIILISSSGSSKNIINAANFAKKNKNYIVTFTGFSGKNPLSNKGNLNFIVNSKKYNHIENVHQYFLLLVVDLVKKNLKSL